MIIGLGTDLMDIRRMEKTLKRFGARFTHRICTENERAKAERRANATNEYAKCFAAKEACAKALGTGFRKGVFWRDMELGNLRSGKPTLHLSGGARDRLDAITPDGFVARINISLTDEYPTAQAVVIISAIPTDWADKVADET